jgi:diaminohydroxyphosphoribosylaminopyrimidine deaminase/5-amino-6-(5-phosphoribosylamino)uracil reductase
MKVAMTLDGRIAPPPGEDPLREPYWISGEASRAAVQTLRWQSDAVVAGVGTVLADDPLLTDRSGQSRRLPLLRVILDSSLRLPLEAKLVASAHDDVLVFTVSTDEARISALRERGVRVEVLPSEVLPAGGSSSSLEQGTGRVPLGKVLEKLGEDGILTLLTETGSRLNTALLAEGLVDRLQLFVSPQLMGSSALSAFGPIAPPLRMDKVEVERCGDDLALSSLLKNPWPEASI